MFVTFGMIGINAVGVDGDIDFIGSRIFLVKGKCTVEVFKCAVQPAVSQMLNAEINKGMLSLFVNFVIRCDSRAGRE